MGRRLNLEGKDSNEGAESGAEFYAKYHAKEYLEYLTDGGDVDPGYFN